MQFKSVRQKCAAVYWSSEHDLGMTDPVAISTVGVRLVLDEKLHNRGVSMVARVC